MRPATPQRTALKLRSDQPTPTIEPVMVWVVEAGTPRNTASASVIAPLVSAQKPPTGFSFVMFMPTGYDATTSSRPAASSHPRTRAQPLAQRRGSSGLMDSWDESSSARRSCDRSRPIASTSR
jgi:hypothetical protein